MFCCKTQDESGGTAGVGGGGGEGGGWGDPTLPYPPSSLVPHYRDPGETSPFDSNELPEDEITEGRRRPPASDGNIAPCIYDTDGESVFFLSSRPDKYQNFYIFLSFTAPPPTVNSPSGEFLPLGRRTGL